MKVKTFIVSSILGAGLYLLYQKRHVLQNSLTESKQHFDRAKADADNIKNSLLTINQQTEKLAAISQELAYKFRVLQEESQSHLAEIKKTTQKYGSKD
ncbi:hypothetical protein ACVR0O_01505 [Streptococcus caviae]|uniref:hypothetical protein n=1 Tax=Streptococcus sp. 'caviae' TaxID=1915004 RepID=UPI00094B867E|nr:hypothetical protein [Streptococcus sp. 'caviae']OLN84585.1 hypothetical protein BMI76_00465 [Streptococcus sp. 'caviae']